VKNESKSYFISPFKISNSSIAAARWGWFLFAFLIIYSLTLKGGESASLMGT